MISELKKGVVEVLSTHGLYLDREGGDRSDVPIVSSCGHPVTQKLPWAPLHKEFVSGRGAQFPRLPRAVREEEGVATPPAGPLGRPSGKTVEIRQSWRGDYASLTEQLENIVDVLDDQPRRGKAIKKDKNHTESSRRAFCSMAQERAPVASDLKRVLREKAQRGESTFALTSGVCEAHRQIPIHPIDWHRPACLVDSGGPIFIKRSALPTWLQHLTTGREQRPLSDDASSRLLSWSKTAYAIQSSWVSFELIHSSPPARHLAKESRVLCKVDVGFADAHTVNISTFEECVGRVKNVADASENEGPFLSPLYKYESPSS